MNKKIQPKTINFFLTLIADSITFWGVFSFCIFLYNTGLFGLSRSIFDVTQKEIFLAYLLFLYVLYNCGAYRKKRDFAGIKRLKSVIQGTLQTVLIYIVLAYTIKYQIPRIISISFIITIPMVAIFSRLIMQSIEANFFQHINQENILIFGAGKIGNAFVDAVSKLSSSPLNIIGFIDDRKNINKSLSTYIPILGDLNNLESLIISHKIDHIIVAIKEPSSKKNFILRQITDRYNISLSFHPTKKLFEKNPYKLDDIAGLPLLSNIKNSITQKPFYNLFKRLFDLIFSFFSIIIISPICLIVSIAIKINDGGPIFFKQTRIGLNEKPFKIYKFRSMKVDAKKYEHCPENAEDPRITKIGKWIRKLSIDEIPQLINVIKGDMSIIGPRPALDSQIDLINARTKLGIQKLMPGITGWAQINGRDEINIEEKVSLDYYYSNNRTFNLKLKIVFITILKVFKSEDIKI